MSAALGGSARDDAFGHDPQISQILAEKATWDCRRPRFFNESVLSVPSVASVFGHLPPGRPDQGTDVGQEATRCRRRFGGPLLRQVADLQFAGPFLLKTFSRE